MTGLGQVLGRSDAAAAHFGDVQCMPLIWSVGSATNTAMWSGSSDIAASGEPGTVAVGVATALRATGPGLSDVGAFQVGASVLPGIPTGAYTVDTRLVVSIQNRSTPVFDPGHDRQR